MPPRQSPTLTEAELRIMDVLWQRGSSTVQEVLERLSLRPALAYNSVLTTIRVIKRVTWRTDGRAGARLRTCDCSGRGEEVGDSPPGQPIFQRFPTNNWCSTSWKSGASSRRELNRLRRMMERSNDK